jgi:hypothetical protein
LHYCLGLHAFRRLPWWIFAAIFKPQLKDLAVRHPAAENFGGYATCGTDFGNGATAAAVLRRRGG